MTFLHWYTFCHRCWLPESRIPIIFLHWPSILIQAEGQNPQFISDVAVDILIPYYIHSWLPLLSGIWAVSIFLLDWDACLFISSSICTTNNVLDALRGDARMSPLPPKSLLSKGPVLQTVYSKAPCLVVRVCKQCVEINFPNQTGKLSGFRGTHKDLDFINKRITHLKGLCTTMFE